MCTHSIKLGIERLQAPTKGRLVARGTTWGQLQAALEADDISVLGITAPGGTGKSALVRTWLDKLDLARYGVDCTYAWHFYDTEKRTTTSSNDFFLDALKSLDATEIDGLESTFLSEEKKASLLSETLSRRGLILVLDGLEVLQQHGIEPQGKLFDVAIRSFLTKVAERVAGQKDRLVIITTREPVVDLESCKGYHSIPLSTFKEVEGAQLLRQLGVVGENKELQAASNDYGGHALALVLLGELIKSEFEDNNIINRHEIPLFEPGRPPDTEDEDWNHATQILTYYAQQISTPQETVLLKMMALLHRPLDTPERSYLLKHADFAREFAHLSDAQCKHCYDRLEQLGLLHPAPSQPRTVWDCHTLIREYFRTSFKEDSPGLWRQAHGVLFDYLQGVPRDYQPSTKTELMPLYRAVHHGCLAERYSEALKVYRERIMQDDVIAHGANELGAIAEDSAVLRMFFQPNETELFTRASEELDIVEQAWLQARTAFCLTYLGQLHEAISHRKKELYLCQEQEKNPNLSHEERSVLLKDTSYAAGQLSELLLLVGDLDAAKQYANTAVEQADKSDNWRQRMISFCRLAAVAHMQGEFDAADRLFQEAIAIQNDIEPKRPVLYSDHGFLYRRFRYRRGIPDHEYEEFRREASAALDIDDRFKPPNRWLVAIGLDYLSQACARAGQAKFMVEQVEHTKDKFKTAYETLVSSGSVIYFPELYISKARFSHQQGFPGDAIEIADEALKYAEAYRMPLYEADANLLKAQCLFAIGDLEQAHSCLRAAEGIINERGYGRRNQDLAELKKMLNNC